MRGQFRKNQALSLANSLQAFAFRSVKRKERALKMKSFFFFEDGMHLEPEVFLLPSFFICSWSHRAGGPRPLYVFSGFFGSRYFPMSAPFLPLPVSVLAAVAE
jgi:hypothetical protein